MAAKGGMCHELVESSIGHGVLDNLSAVFDREEAEVAILRLKHEMVGLPDLAGGGLESGHSIGEAGRG